MSENITEEGIVVSISNGCVRIALTANDNCNECSAKIICKPKDDSVKTLTINNSSEFNIGDKVTISIPGKTLFIASINLYFYPLLVFITAILFGMELFTNSNYTELYSFLTAFLCLTIYYAIFFMISRKFGAKQPTIILSR